jgi:hypothetical protein
MGEGLGGGAGRQQLSTLRCEAGAGRRRRQLPGETTTVAARDYHAFKRQLHALISRTNGVNVKSSDKIAPTAYMSLKLQFN